MKCKFCYKNFDKGFGNFCSKSCIGKYARSKVKIYKEKWSLKYDKCKLCGSVKNRHKGNGYCIKCFFKTKKSKDRYKAYYLKNRKGILRRNKKWVNKNSYWKEFYWRNKSSLKYKKDLLRYGITRYKILARDDFKCVRCGIKQEEHLLRFGVELAIHHMDHNINNNNIDNFETLCFPCHMKEHLDEINNGKTCK